MAEKILLNYNDSLLYESDLDLLSEGNWLNDRLIGFVYEYLEKEVYTDECNETNSLFGFVNPSTVQYLKLCQSLDEAKICFIDPLGLDRKRFVFFPLNNNAKSEQAGGSHWSLIVLDKVKSSIIHYDSIGSNENTAIDFFKKYKSCFRIKTFSNSDKFPQQTNSSDCGVYVLGNLIFKEKFTFY